MSDQPYPPYKFQVTHPADFLPPPPPSPAKKPTKLHLAVAVCILVAVVAVVGVLIQKSVNQSRTPTVIVPSTAAPITHDQTVFMAQLAVDKAWFDVPLQDRLNICAIWPAQRSFLLDKFSEGFDTSDVVANAAGRSEMNKILNDYC